MRKAGVAVRGDEAVLSPAGAEAPAASVASSRAWPGRDALALGVVTALGALVALPAFRPGVLADNDFVGHYAYVRFLVDELLPATGSHLGWCPWFNTGQPFLLFNPPPLLYVLSAFTTAGGLSALASLKLWMLAAFLSVPLLVYAIARSLRGLPEPFPICAALLTGLFTSELFGLDFYFRNGMLNAAFAVPFLLATVLAFRRAVEEPLGRAVGWLALAGAAFALTLLTHVQTAYMAALCLAAFVTTSGRDAWAETAARAAVAVGLGVLLAGWWLVPSLTAAGYEPAAYTWIRPPRLVLESLFTGELFSSYEVGFFGRFFSRSAAGSVVVALGAVGAASIVRGRARALVPFLVVSLLALWLALGPAVAGPLWALPLYGRLLWYRFLTLAILGWMFVAGLGLANVVEGSLGGPRWRTTALRGLALAGLVWAATVLVHRGGTIRTEADYPSQRADLQRIADWLGAHADRSARLYNEFPKFNVDDATSVNYGRHLLPVLTGVDDLAGWVYENNQAGQLLMARGLVWDNPFPILSLNDRYNVKYVVGRSPNFLAALRRDPRWALRVRTDSGSLFEAFRYRSRPVEGSRPGTRIAEFARGPMPGGGYRIGFVAHLPATASPSHLVVKSSFSPQWTATVDGRAARVVPSEDGLIDVEVPPNASGKVAVELAWSLGRFRPLGWLASALGLAGAAALVGAFRGRRRDGFFARSPRIGRAWVIAAAVAFVAVVVGRWARADARGIAWGYRDAMLATDPMNVLDVGTYGDTDNGQQNFVVERSWSRRTLLGTRAARTTRAGGETAVFVAVAPGRAAVVTVDGAFGARGAAAHASGAFSIVVRDRRGATLCEVAAGFGRPVTIPAACVKRAAHGHDAPGTRLGLGFRARWPLVVTRVAVDGGIGYLEGESLLNTLDDRGADGFYYIGKPGLYAHNGALMTVAVSDSMSPVTLRRRVPLGAPGEYELWARVLAGAPETALSRADVDFNAGRERIGTITGVSLSAGRPRRGLVAVWKRVGRVRADGAIDLVVNVRSVTAENEWADIDVLALVPERDPSLLGSRDGRERVGPSSRATGVPRLAEPARHTEYARGRSVPPL